MNSSDGLDNKTTNKVSLIETVKKYKKIYFIVLLSLFTFSVILIAINIIYIFKDDKKVDNKKIDEIKTEEQGANNTIEQKNLTPRKIDGIMVEYGQENLSPYAAIIENSVDARPLSGINEANIIYEAQAEGSVTRFLAIYADSKNIEKIGPIRSARPYYAELADEYSPLFIHFGGSPEVLEKIKNGFYNLTSLNGMVYDGIYLYREKNKAAPHNAYISTELIKEYLNQINKTNNSGYYTGWLFNDVSKNYYQQKNLESINVIYHKEINLYNVTWKYNAEYKNFTRYLFGGNDKYLDDKNNDIIVENIIIQFVTSQISDAVGRKNINLTEGGKAIMIRDGKYVEGYWSKNNLLNRTKFITYDEKGGEIEYELKPGKTWVHIVPKENYDLIKNK